MKHILSIIIVLLTLSFSNQEKECSDIKNGKFKYSDSSSNEVIEIRKDSIQIDSFPSIGLSYQSKVKWTSDCNYQITIFKVNDPEFDSLIGITFEFEILSIEKDQIKLKTKTVNKEHESEYFMKIID